MKSLPPVIAFLAAMLVLQCAEGPAESVEPGAPIQGLPRELSPAEVTLIEADNRFALKLFSQINEQDKSGSNVFVSPLSVAMALGMALGGADGTTLEAMRGTLELEGLSIREVNESYGSLIGLLRGLDPSVEFQIANSIWYDERYTFEQEFLDAGSRYFDAEVAGLDFTSSGAAKTINRWVEEGTNGKIGEIVADPIPAEIFMFLINAIYFKGDWTTQFDKELTRDQPFSLADGSQISVPTMSHPAEIEFGYSQGGGVEVIDLPYGGRAYSMTILLPALGADIDPLIESLDDQKWQALVEGLSAFKGFLLLPKFTLEYELEMKAVLEALGMGIAFSPDAANFTKIYRGPERAYISKVKHKTFVDVNEEGTEAAAATSVEIGVTSAPPVVAVDRPFVFAIRENYSGSILFMGKIMDPTRPN